MKKTVKLDLSSDRLIAVAADLVDEHKYINALKMLNKNAELNGNDEDSYMLYAEIFDDLELFESCVNYWYKFMDCNSSGDLSEAYEGLASAYLNLGKGRFAAYYYNKLVGKVGVDPEERAEIMSDFLELEKNPLKFVYPPQLNEFADEISDGVDLMKSGKFAQAVLEFEKVEDESPSYLRARNYIAMCKIIDDKNEEAEQECLAILKKDPENVHALTSLAALKTEQKKFDESKQLAHKLLGLEIHLTDDIYKVATVCCENKMHAEAYKLFCKLEKMLPIDSTLMFFKAISAFNCGNYEQCFSAFDTLLTVYPESVTANYHYRKAREAAENGEPAELGYFYRMPEEERESTLKVLTAFSELSNAQTGKLSAMMDITDCVLWCFDEKEGGGTELQFLAALCAVKARLDDIVRNILLNAFLEDPLKIRILSVLGERNEEDSFGVVMCHMYKNIDFYPVNVGRTKRKYFIAANARLIAHFSVVSNSSGKKFAKATEEMYEKLKAENRLKDIADLDALTAAIYCRSGVNKPSLPSDRLSLFFNTTEDKIKKILGEI